MTEMKLNCPSAYHRLYEIGMPATTEHEIPQSSTSNRGSDAKAVAKVVHSFVTVIDAIKLGIVTVEHLHPLLSELLRNINRTVDPNQDVAGIRENMKSWLISLNKRRPSEQLSAEEVETLEREVEDAHDKYFKSIK